MNQLKKGHLWLKHTMKLLNFKPWTYIGFVVFPNIDCKKDLIDAGLAIPEDRLKVE